MMNESLDSGTLRALSPHAVAAYLKAKGWVDQGKWGQFALLFARERDGIRKEVVVPTKATILDFERRMAELLQEIAEAEQQRPSRILNDLAAAPFDVLRIRAREADEYGSITLEAGHELFDVGRSLLVTAAIQAASPKTRPVLRGRRPEEANEYLERVRLGQTERGSFVLTLLSPYSFDPADQSATQATLFDDGKPFGRRVTENLSTALRSVEQALEQAVGAGAEAFKQFADQGVSANLCTALARLADLGGGADISLSWSPQKPLQGEARLSLQRNDASVLKDAAAAISAEAGPQTIRLEGTVLGITERKDQFDGTVTLHVVLDGKPRSVRIQFGDADRNKVFEAFHGKTGLLMAVEGELVKEGGFLRLANPRGFEVIKIDDG